MNIIDFLNENQTPKNCVTTLSRRLDQFFGNGIQAGVVTEFVGKAGTGKRRMNKCRHYKYKTCIMRHVYQNNNLSPQQLCANIDTTPTKYLLFRNRNCIINICFCFSYIPNNEFGKFQLQQIRQLSSVL